MKEIKNKGNLKGKIGQMEMMGLAIIVILVAVALLFVVKFMIMKPESALPVVNLNIKANNALNALVKTNMPSGEETMAELLVKTSDPTDTVSFDLAEQEVIKILDASNLKECYKLIVNDVSIADKTQGFEDLIASSSYFISSEGVDLYEVKLYLCKK